MSEYDDICSSIAEQVENEVSNRYNAIIKVAERRILVNFINNMTKVYRERNANWVVVRDILLSGTSTSGRTSCIKKCFDLGIDPYSYSLESKGEWIDGKC